MGHENQHPGVLKPNSGVIKSEEELEYGLRGIVRLLGRRGNKTGYFFERIAVMFSSELPYKVEYEQTYLDHENLKIIIELPDPENSSLKEKIRSQINQSYTFGADDYKTRAALSAWEGLDQRTKEALVKKEKEIEQTNKESNGKKNK